MKLAGIASRIDAVDRTRTGIAVSVNRLVDVAMRGLHAAYDPDVDDFVQTVRAVRGPGGVQLRREGRSLRYAAIAALGLGRLRETRQRDVLRGLMAADITALAVRRAELVDDDPGAVALALWAAAEAGTFPATLVARLQDTLASGRPLPTVDAAWTLTAAVKANALGDTDALVEAATELLCRHDGPAYPHLLPANSARWRGHVGSFADQVYPLQALALTSRLSADADLLARADRIADTIVTAQGSAGQWWWHYDARDGSVVERYPVYSVHQHAMAPMVLFDLWESGGADHRRAIARGLDWLNTHPETLDELITERHGLVWRKVGRREPRKAARAAGALTTSVRPGLRLPGLDRVLPPGPIDHECRPYELGWLLYAWLPAGGSNE